MESSRPPGDPPPAANPTGGTIPLGRRSPGASGPNSGVSTDDWKGDLCKDAHRLLSPGYTSQPALRLANGKDVFLTALLGNTEAGFPASLSFRLDHKTMNRHRHVEQTISAENRFLLLCARIQLSKEEEQELRLLIAGPLDWNFLLTGAKRHAISPLVYYHLRALEASTQVPPMVWQKLEKDFQAARLRTMRQHFAVGKLLKTLNQAEVRIIPLKGIFLRETIFPDPALRVSGDIDLLIQPEDLDQTRQILRRLDYLPKGHSFFTDQYLPEKHHHLVPYQLNNRDVEIEVHWNLAPPRYHLPVDMDGVWERSRPGQTTGQEVNCLSPEDLLLHLAIHAGVYDRTRFQHPLIRLRHLIDIAETVHSYQQKMDWDTVTRRAKEWQAEEFLYITLTLAKELLGLDQVEGILDAVKPANFNDAHLHFARQAILVLPENPVRDIAMTETLLHFHAAGSLKNKAQLILKTIFPTQSVIASRYAVRAGSTKAYWFSLVNPLLLLRRYLLNRVFGIRSR